MDNKKFVYVEFVLYIINDDTRLHIINGISTSNGMYVQESGVTKHSGYF